jgi:uncharacterized protein (DUF2267 family)
MKYDEFIAEVQRRARLRSRGEAEAAVSATLTTLSERLAGGEAKDLASQLPPEIGQYLMGATSGMGQPFLLDEFFWRISEREGVDLNDATFHARVVTGLLTEAVTMGEIENVRAQLPKDFAQLFNVENEGTLPEVEELPEQVE